MTNVDWSSSGGSEDFIVYDFSMGFVRVYLAENIAPVKRQEVDDGPMVPVMGLAIVLN